MNFYNRVKFTTATTGTGTLTVGSAEAGFRTPAQASVPTGTIVRYKIEDTGNAWEIGYGVYTSAGTTLSRTVTQSSNSDNAIDLSGSAVVALIHAAQDSNLIDPYGIHHRLDTTHADDDEFDDASIAGAWTQIAPNGGAGTYAWAEGAGALHAEFVSIASGRAAAIVKAATLSDGQAFETRVRIAEQATTHPSVGIMLTDGTTNTSNAFGIWYYSETSVPKLGGLTGALSNFSGVSIGVGNLSYRNTDLRFRLFRTNSTTFGIQISTGGVLWTQYGSTANPGFTPTHAGLWVSNWGGTLKCIASFDYFRHIT